jgi:uncharacterized protein YeaO (DUF488 family)
MAISVKRVYDAPSRADGLRVLVDRIWPRGLSKSTAKIDLWIRELSPSHGLRKWYAHDAKKWPEFKRRFLGELKTQEDAFESLLAQAKKRKVTLLFGSKEPRLNNAFALKEALESRARRSKLLTKPSQRTHRKPRAAKRSSRASARGSQHRVS